MIRYAKQQQNKNYIITQKHIFNKLEKDEKGCMYTQLSEIFLSFKEKRNKDKKHISKYVIFFELCVCFFLLNAHSNLINFYKEEI